MSISFLIVTLGKSGLAKKAPGTVGTMVSLLFWVPLLFANTPSYLRVVLSSLVFFLGIRYIQKSLHMFEGKDPKSIVIDEAAGMGFTLCLCTPNLVNVALGFLLFRFFDIVKPWPISWCDKKVDGPFGIMFDDFLAGLFSLMILYGLYLWHPAIFG